MKKLSLRLSAMVMVLVCFVAVLAVPVSAKSDLPSIISEAQEGVVKLFVVAFDDNNEPLVSTVGSGFAVGRMGEAPEYFVTNWHVATAYLEEYNYAFDSNHVRIWIMLDDFTLSDVTGLPSEATSVECSIVRTSESGYPDYAILKSSRPVKECKPLTIKSSKDAQQGETVVALGCPSIVDAQSLSIGSNDITATTGAVARHMVMASAGNTSVILHTAVISGGNSGGPLIDEKGNVVGLNTYGIVDNYACAIYSDYIMQILDELSIPYMVAGGLASKISVIAAGAITTVVLVAVFFFLRKRKGESTSSQRSNSVGNQTVPVGSSAPSTAAVTAFRLQMPDGRIIPLQTSKVTVGRDPSCQILFPENATSVSRQHCTLENAGELLILVDEGSRNGTYIHGKKIPVGAKVALKRGSSFCVGTTENRITVC